MSHPSIDRSPDLKRLRDEGYEVHISEPSLLITSIPYVNANRAVQRGTLVSELSMAGGVTIKPGNHAAHFAGDFPCKPDGSELPIRHPGGVQMQGNGIKHSFSLKITGTQEYANYYDKVSTYVNLIESQAQVIDPNASAKTFRTIPMSEDKSPFKYFDSATSRAGIGDVAEKLIIPKLAIVGLGGTGSYVLDFVAKTPPQEIHLFDGDTLFNHNAFRAPGAASLEQLDSQPKKVAYLTEIYSRMRWKIIPHDFHITSANVELLREMNFVFICIDGGPTKRIIVERLEEWNVPFIDVGMGIQLVDGKLRGALAVTTSVSESRQMARGRMSFDDTTLQNDYAQNIQIAELNALNATLAVIKWKKLCGFYHDFQREHFSSYTLDGDKLLNEDQL
jgi:hypothetical protein